MKRLIVVTVIAAALVAVLASAAWAQGPATPAAGTNPPVTCPAGMAPGVGYRGGMMGGGMPTWAGMVDEVAELLGMTEAEIQAERQAGKSLVEIAAAKDVTEATLVQTILAARQVELDKLVVAGTLTQAQADQMLETMKTRVTDMVRSTDVGPAWGRGVQGSSQGVRQGMGGRGMMGRGAQGGGMMGSRWTR